MNDAFGKWIPMDVAAVGAVQSRRTAPYGVKCFAGAPSYLDCSAYPSKAVWNKFERAWWVSVLDAE
jgi:hypothetical protein